MRVAERRDGEWTVNEWAKKAILLYFRLRKVEPMEVGGLHFLDKIPVKADYADRGVRVVPPGVARYGSFLSEGVVLMPGFVNIGAWVGPRTMVDTWATVGSCAQIGADVHLSGGVGIGGVLEPPQARPVIVEDGAFVGSRAVIVEGVVVGEGAVIAPNVVLSASMPIIDVTGSDAGRAPGLRSAALRRSSGHAAEGLSGWTLRSPVRADRRRAKRLDGSQDVAQRRSPRIRDRDVSERRSSRSRCSRTTSSRPRRSTASCSEPARGRVARGSDLRRRRREGARPRAGRGNGGRPPNEDHVALSVADLDDDVPRRSLRAGFAFLVEPGTIRGVAPRTSATRTDDSWSSPQSL